MQRIQTLYLLAVTALLAIFCTNTLAVFSATDGIYSLSVFGVTSADGAAVTNAPHLLVLALLALVLPFVNIFLFRKRMLQLRLCVVEIVLTIGLLIVAGIYYFLSCRLFGVGSSGAVSVRIVCILPLVAIFFDFLALKAIFKDEMLIKSLDRIR
ncbi:MAG: DUF4293 domain-containing protein [Rikenellaceae bacterium]